VQSAGAHEGTSGAGSGGSQAVRKLRRSNVLLTFCELVTNSSSFDANREGKPAQELDRGTRHVGGHF
jgi:hypothetical protein